MLDNRLTLELVKGVGRIRLFDSVVGCTSTSDGCAPGCGEAYRVVDGERIGGTTFGTLIMLCSPVDGLNSFFISDWDG